MKWLIFLFLWWSFGFKLLAADARDYSARLIKCYQVVFGKEHELQKFESHQNEPSSAQSEVAIQIEKILDGQRSLSCSEEEFIACVTMILKNWAL